MERDILERSAFREAQFGSEIHHPLDRRAKCLVLGPRVAENIHVEANTLVDERLADSTCPDHGHGFPGDIVAKPRVMRMPDPPPTAAHQILGGIGLSSDRTHHEEGELCGCIGQDIGSVRDGNPITRRGRDVDIVLVVSRPRPGPPFGETVLVRGGLMGFPYGVSPCNMGK